MATSQLSARLVTEQTARASDLLPAASDVKSERHAEVETHEQTDLELQTRTLSSSANSPTAITEPLALLVATRAITQPPAQRPLDVQSNTQSL